MAVNAPVNSAIDVRLPNTPEQVNDPAVFNELMIIYSAIRNLQAAIVPQYTTTNRPSYKKGLLIFDTTLNKLVVGGATTWEVVTSV